MIKKLVAKVRGCERYVELNVAFMTDTHIEEFLIGFKGDVAKSFNVIGEYLVSFLHLGLTLLTRECINRPSSPLNNR